MTWITIAALIIALRATLITTLTVLVTVII